MKDYKYVYRLEHKKKVEPDGDSWVYDSKLIGYYSSVEKAEKTIEKYKNITGFKDYPDDFYIKELEIDFDDFDFI
jgi:hypothetical protein